MAHSWVSKRRQVKSEGATSEDGRTPLPQLPTPGFHSAIPQDIKKKKSRRPKSAISHTKHLEVKPQLKTKQDILDSVAFQELLHLEKIYLSCKKELFELLGDLSESELCSILGECDDKIVINKILSMVHELDKGA